MHEKLRRALESVGIQELTELQKRAFDAIYSGEDTLIIAPTGSGKTEAAIVPVFQRMLEKRSQGICVLYITPLRALNRDMLRRIKGIAEFLGISVDVRHGDTKESERTKQSRRPPEVLITTPETFQILFLGKKLRNALKNVRFLIIDEIHELIDNERGVQLFVAVERLREIAKFQLVALSATISDPRKVAEIVKCSKIVTGGIEKEYEFRILRGEEVSLIKEIVSKHNSVLIFVNTRQTAEALGLLLKPHLPVEVHHGSLSRDARVAAEENFAKGHLKALICTSSMELGIDIGRVDAVVQYSSPRQAIRLIQRVGRSGHGLGRKSVGYIVANSVDDVLESYAIVERAKRGELEDTEIHENSLDVLANQICAIAIEYGRIEAKKVYEIVRRCYFFRNLSFEEFDEVCRYLASLWRIFYDGTEIAARKRTRKYFYDNISMIPDERSYKVIDVTSGKVIGVLDESFLSNFSGEVFAMKGELWRVLSVEGEFVKVEPASHEGEIPSWTGEEIPVPFEVAQEVGRLRKLLLKGLDLEICDEESRREVLEKIREHAKEFEIPSDDCVVIEGSDKNVIVNVCFGHKANEAIGRIIALLLSLKRGTNVSVEVDPYRIKLYPASPEEVKEIVLNVREVEKLAETAVLDTRLMQWKIVKVARKFGFFDKEDDLSRINLRNLIVKLRETPIYREALREIFVEKLDVERAKIFFEKIGKDIRLFVYKKFTPLGIEAREKVPDVLIAKSPEIVLKAFKDRIMSEICRVQCANCGSSYKEPLKDLKLRCIRCGSSLVAVVSEKKKELNREETIKVANLIASYGIRAVYAMLTYGIGFETAKRILSRFFETEDDFFKALLEAERNYIRTRRFWD